MSERHRRGLVVGKFCPLHRGHELVIRTALAQCDEVLVISYTRPAFERCDADARERWLADRFPQTRRLVLDVERFAALAAAHHGPGPATLPHNDDADATHRDFVGWLCDRVLDCSVDAVFTSEDYGDGFAAALTAYFRQRRDPQHAEVRHVCVDRERQAIPISGSALRRDPHAHREHLSPAVYADFVQRACLLGGESSGKTALAQALAERLGTAWVPEYGRQRWVEQGGALVYDDLLQIARTQLAHEREHATHAHRWLFCDTSPLTILLYSRDLFGRADAELERLAAHRYDHVFLCAPDFPFVQDGTRRDDAFRQQQHAAYLHELEASGIAYTLLGGTFEQRIAEVTGLLSAPAPTVQV
jgi:NadR type nicotinamide-nucleotide adenylyltransferase